MFINTLKLVWLAGFFDGEGTIGFYKTTIRNRLTYIKTFAISNNDYFVMEEVKDILERILNRPIYLTNDLRASKRHPYISFKVSIRKHSDLLKILLCLEPYLVSKKKQAQVMIKHLKEHKVGARYGEDGLSLEKQLKFLKRATSVTPNQAEKENFSGVRREHKRPAKAMMCSDTPTKVGDYS